MHLPDTKATPLIRTDFNSDAAWREAVQLATAESPDGFRANLTVVDDPAFNACDPAQLAELAKRTKHIALIVVADSFTTGDPERSLLCIDPFSQERPFRVIPSELWGVENNVSLANMEFADFASATDANGVFRGFTR